MGNGTGKTIATVGGTAALVALFTKLLQSKPAAAAPTDEKLIYLTQLQEVNSLLLQKVLEGFQQLISDAPIILEPTISPVLLTIPLTPSGITDIIKHADKKGVAWYPIIHITWLCAAGVVTTLPLAIPLGWVATDRSKSLVSDYYDRLIYVDIYVDNHLITIPGTSLATPIEVYFGEYWIKHEGSSVIYTINNTTATDAYVTLSGWSELLEKSFYAKTYAPLVKKMYDSLEAIV